MVAIVTGNGVGLQRSSGFVLGSNGTLGDPSLGRLGSNVAVNAATGNLIIQNQDELLIGRGPDSIFSRSYNSLGLLNDENGDNWRESSQRTVVLTSGTVNTSGSTVTHTDWDGSNVLYSWDGSKYVSKDGVGSYDTLTFASNVWTWTDGDSRVKETYDSANSGRITASQDTDGNALSFTYTGALLTKVTTAGGDYTELSYTGNNLTQLITKSSGGTVLASRVRYGYDTSNRLTTVTVDLSPTDNSISDNNVVTYSYTYDGTSKRVASISETGSTGSNGIVTFQYDTSFRITLVRETGSDGGNRDTSFSYNTATRVTTVTDALGKVTELTYDTNGNLTQVKYPPAVSGASQQIVQYAYNANGDVTSITDAGGKVTAFAYDASGNLTQQRDAAGNTIDRTYDSNNQLLNEIHYLTPDPDGAGSGTASNPVVTRRAYDSKNHLRFVVDAEGLVTEYRYNAAGQLVCTFAFPSAAYNVTSLGATATLSETTMASWASGLAQSDKDLVQAVQTLYDYRGNISSTVEFQGYVQPTDASASGGATSPTYNNRVHFSQFEQGTHGWEFASPNNILGNTGTGLYNNKYYIAADIAPTAANQTATIRSDSTHRFYVTAGERLAVQAGATGSGPISNAKLYISFYDNSGTLISGSPVLLDTKTNIATYNTRMGGFVSAVPSGAVSARLELTVTSSGSGSGWFDLVEPMVSVATSSQTTQPSFEAGSTSDDMSPPSSTPVTYNNRVHFSQFEQGTHGWEFASPNNILGNTGTGLYNNKYYIAADIAPTAANQTATIRSDSTHRFYVTAGERLAVQAGATGGGPISNAKLYISFYDNSGTLISGSPVLLDTKTNIATYNTRMGGFVDTVPTGAVTARLELTVTSSGSGSGWFDLVEPMVSVATSGQTTQPSFEAGSTSDDMSPPSSTPVTYNNRVHFSQLEQGTHGWEFASPNNILGNTGTGLYNNKYYIAADIAPTAANQTATIRSDSTHRFYVTAGERLAVQAGATGSGPISNAKLYISFYDNSGTLISGSPVLLDTKTNIATYNTRMGGFVDTVPTGAVSARLELTVTSSGSGSGWFDLVEPMVSVATSGQTTQPSFEAGSTSDDMSPPSSTPAVTVTSLRTTNYVYDQFGLLISRQVSGVSGSEVYSYDGLGRVKSATDLAGNITTTSINDSARTTTVTLANGLVKTSTFTAQGELASYAESASDISTETETYKYDKLGRLRITSTALSEKDFTFYDDAGRKVGYLDRRGFLTEYRYDAANRLIVTIGYANAVSSTAGLYDTNGNPNAVAIATMLPTATNYDRWTWNIYDNADRVVETITTVDGAAQSPFGAVTTYAYDGDDRITATTRFANRLSQSAISGYKTTPPTSTALPTANAAIDRTTRYLYDKSGRVLRTMDGIGGLVETKYDKAGRVVETIGYVNFATAIDTLPASNAADRHDYIVYDGRGDVKYTLDANLRPTEYVYDPLGNVIRIVDYGAPVASTTSYSLSYVSGQISSLNLAANAATRITRAVYDGAERKIFDINAEGYVTGYAYNAVGQIIKQTRYATKYTTSGDPLLSAMQSWATSNGGASDRIDRQIFDALGRLAYEVDAEGYITEHQYDLNDRLTKDIRYAAPYTVADGATKASIATQIGTLPGTAVVITYAYDAEGNLIDRYDGLNIRTHYSYTAFGQAWQMIEAYNTADAAETGFVFDSAGRMINKITAVGMAEQATTAYGYDGVGNLTTIYDPRGYTTTRTYDAIGNLLSETVPLDASTNAVTARQYDAFGNVVKLTDPRNNAGYFYYDKLGRLELQIDAEGYATTTTYNIGDQPLTTKRYYQRATGTGSVTTRPTLTNDAKDALTGFSYDKLDRLTATTDAEGYTENYTLNAFGDRIAVMNKLGGTTNNVFDKRGLLTQETLPVGSYLNTGALQSGGTNIVNKFSYDARGNRTQMIEAFGLAEQRTTTYAYDKNNQLISKTGEALTVLNPANMSTSTVSAPAELYDYDLRGNLTRVTDAGGGRIFSYYDDNNRKIAEVRAIDTLAVALGTLSTWSYDGNGNVLSAKVYETPASLPTNPGGTAPTGTGNYRETTFAYDRNNRLSSSTVASVLWGAFNNGLYQTSTQNVVTQTIYDAAGNIIKQQDGRGYDTFNYYDKNGRRLAQVDKGKFLTVWSYDSEGNVLSETRYANAVGIAVDVNTAVASLQSSAGTNANDRTTVFVYDRNGRRLSETRLNVNGWAVSSTGNIAAEQTYSPQIYRLYDAAFDRMPDAFGKDYWMSALINGASLQSIVDQFYASPEYQNRGVGSMTNDQYVEFLYTSVLRRPSDAPGKALYVNALNNQTSTRAQLLLTFSESTEHSNVIATIPGRTASGTNAVVSYAYNGLGEVTRKTEATGDSTTYVYDSMGRQTQILSDTFVDQLIGINTTKTTSFYDGLNNLTRTSTDSGYSATGNAHVTQFSYGAGGRLSYSIDAQGFRVDYYYDAVGRSMGQSYTVLKSDGSSTLSAAKTITYDLAGRTTSQKNFQVISLAWAQVGDTTNFSYNAYGDVTGRGVNGLYQETFSYDNAGRVWRSTAGDGAYKFYVYDQNGNQTLQIGSSGADLSGYGSISAALNGVTSNGASPIGTAAVSGVTFTSTSYDNRNLAFITRELFRETTATGSAYSELDHSKTYNAFGEVTSETNARGYTTSYSYNTMGKLTQKVMPTVSVTAENGAQSNVTPTENYRYDVSGRLVAVQDANGAAASTPYWTTRKLLANSGYGGTDAKVLKEFHADGGVFETRYDVFGDARVLINEIGKVESRNYDNMGRLTALVRPARTDGSGLQLTEYYAYDGLGQRIKHWNSWLTGTGSVETTDYDVQGRVVSQVQFGGNTTTYSYAWNGALVTTGLGTFGGWTKNTNVTGQGNTLAEVTDYFGRLIDKNDYGNHNYDYTYNKAGWLITQANNAGESTAYTYYNSGKLAQIVSSNTSTNNSGTITSQYKYDAEGNRSYERYATSVNYSYNGYSYSYTTTHQDATASYDALNRMTALSDTGSSAPMSIVWEYDRNGNIRRMAATHRSLDSQGVVLSTSTTDDYWYKYDNMNRFVTTRGMFTGARGSGTISRGSDYTGSGIGRDITYNAAGQRVSSSRTVTETEYYEGAGYPTGTKTQSEAYSYTDDGYLSSVSIGFGAVDPYFGNTPAAPTSYTLRAKDTRDAMGRVTKHQEFDIDGTTVNLSREDTFDNAGRVTAETTVQRRYESGVKYYTTNTTNTYTGGLLTLSSNDTHKGTTLTTDSTTDAALADTSTAYSYTWWDNPLASTTSFDGDTANGSNTLWTSTYNYDGRGHLASVNIADNRTRNVSYVTDNYGQIMTRDEQDVSYPSHGDPHQRYYYFNGARVGEISNNGTDNVDYAVALANPTATTGGWAFRGGADAASPYADFDQSYDAINPSSSGEAGTATYYTVMDGDTLESIAAQLWGDSSYWYVIADANGLSAPDSLQVGQSLTIPNTVHNIHNSSSTFRVYDPNQAIGDTSPTAAKPPKKVGCGGLGMIIIAAIAIAVTAVVAPELLPHATATVTGSTTATITTAGLISTSLTVPTFTLTAASALGTAVAAGAAAAIGTAVAQGIGVATGLQNNFSWKGVALAGISGGLAQGLAGSGIFKAFGIAGNGFLANAARGALTNAATQGVSVATGLQKKFDWTGIAAAGIVAGASGGAARELFHANPNMLNTGQQLVTGMAGAIAGSATRSLISGTDFGDNIMAVLPDVLGNTIGNLAAERIASLSAPRAQQSGAASPQPGSSGTSQAANGQSASADDVLPGDIVVTARRAGSGGYPFQVLSTIEQARLIAAVIGKSVKVNDTVLDQNGKSVRVQRDYVIKGPNSIFDTVDAAAVDALAASWAIRDLAGDNFERGGDIMRTADGKYTYNSIETGRMADLFEESGVDIRINGSTVANFHTHPFDNPANKSSLIGDNDRANRNFSAGDKRMAQAMFDGLHREIPAYLGNPQGAIILNSNLRSKIADFVTIKPAGFFTVAPYIGGR